MAKAGSGVRPSFNPTLCELIKICSMGFFITQLSDSTKLPDHGKVEFLLQHFPGAKELPGPPEKYFPRSDHSELVLVVVNPDSDQAGWISTERQFDAAIESRYVEAHWLLIPGIAAVVFAEQYKMQYAPALHRTGVRFDFRIDAVSAMAVIANIQLATRHTGNTGPSRKIAEAFARQLQAHLIKQLPELESLIEMGWDPQYDVV